MRVRLKPAATVPALTALFVAIALAWSGFLGALQVSARSSPLDKLDSLALGWRYGLAGPRPAPRGVVIAAIDEETLRALGAYPVPRDALARILRALNAEAPQVVGVDILFLDPGPPEADRALAEALREGRAVICAMGVFDRNAIVPAPEQDDAPPNPAEVLWPQAAFRAAAEIGLSNISLDALGTPRYAPLLFAAEGGFARSFALATATAASHIDAAFLGGTVKIGAASVALDYGRNLPLRFYGPAGAVRSFSAAKALRGELGDEELRGATVLLGVTAMGVGDRFVTPFDPSTPGVEVVATAVANLLSGDALVKNAQTRWFDAGVGVVLAVASVLLLAAPRVALGLGLTAALNLLWLAGVFFAFTRGIDLGVAGPLASSLPVAAAYGGARLWAAQRMARHGETLRRFHDPRMAEVLARDPEFLAQPKVREAAVVFVDLSGYSGASEALGPAWTRDLLVAFHALVDEAAQEGAGYVASYMGDGAMILFGLPRPRPDDAARALATMTRLHERANAWAQGLPPAARAHLRARVGGHFGAVALSRLGVAAHQHIAATGDIVNVASRLLETAKQLGAGMVASEDLCVAAGEAAGERREAAIRGRAGPVAVRLWAQDQFSHFSGEI